MLEKHFEDALSKYPELIEEGLNFLDRQVSIGGKFVDLLFEDRFGQKLIIELKSGAIKREHIGQLLDYEGYFLSPDDPNIRVMLIGNHVPTNLKKSLDHHGLEWREIPISKLIEHLKMHDDKHLLSGFEEETYPVPRPITRKESGKENAKKSNRSGSPKLPQALNFEELVQIINIKSEQVASWYMDKLILENKNKTISRLLQDDWWPYAEKIGDRHFPNVSKVKAHLKYREERGWIYEYSGSQRDPIVRLVGFQK